MLARMDATGWTFDHLGKDEALEHTVLELEFAFWQYYGTATCASLPSTAVSDDDLIALVDAVVGFYFASDEGIEAYMPYYLQAARQLGYPAYPEGHLVGLLHPGSYTAPAYVLGGLDATYDPTAMPAVSAWLDQEGARMLFVYGENDPWSASPFDPGGAEDAFVLVVPEGTHGAAIADLGETDRAIAIDAVRRWGGVASKGGAWTPRPRRPMPWVPL
jgi:hypothetical protein